MKRNNEGVPLKMMQRWTRPPMSCQLCRSKKLRCDRTEPCSNCVLRKVECIYAGRTSKRNEKSDELPMALQQTQMSNVSAPAPSSTNQIDELQARIKMLEQAVFDKTGQFSQTSGLTNTPISMTSQQSPTTKDSSPSSLYLPPSKDSPDIVHLTKNLPPKIHALLLLNHLSTTSQLTFGVFHVPSTRNLLIQTYQKLLEAENPGISTYFLLFSIFAAATLIATPSLLLNMGLSVEEGHEAFERYANIALELVEGLQASTRALEGIVCLMHLFTNADGFNEKVHMLRTRALLMARTLQIHRLDTVRNREVRQMQGFNPVEIEVQRRIWWHMVSSDWLLSFSGGPQEGTYLFNPNHMKVNYPRNIDDELIAAAGEQYDFPLSIPTPASAFIWRIKLAEICREVTDITPSIILEPQEVDYATVLEQDAKFRKLLDDFPVFFKLDPISIQQSVDICRGRPSIASHRILLHLGVYTRICRLHRPFLLAGYHDPKFAYSRTSCVRAAQKMLDLRRSMDNDGPCFWTVMQHVFMAAVTLATDVSLDPDAPHAEARKEEVMQACRLLEVSQRESSIAREAVGRGVRTLLGMVQKKCPLMAREAWAQEGRAREEVMPRRIVDPEAEEMHVRMQNDEMLREFGEEDWDQLWSEFFHVSPEWDAPKWNYMMEGIEMNLGPNLS